MAKNDSWGGWDGWVIMFAWVAYYDWKSMRKGSPTMSVFFYRLSRSKAGVFLILFWVYKFLHLGRFMPERWDLFRRGGTIVIRNGYGKSSEAKALSK